jgi:superfamily II DNA or RNA helicase
LIELSNNIRITDASSEEIKQMKNDLSITNPAFDLALRMDLSTWNVPRELQYYKYDGKTFEAPIGYLPNLHLKGQKIVDNRLTTGKNNFTFKGTLRDYQKDAVNATDKNDNGVICMPTATGKTVVICAIICKKNVNTLILVNTLELANQFRNSITKFIDGADEIGLIGKGQFNIKPITIGILQSITKIDWLNKMDQFGMVFCDETHIMGAETYYNAMSLLPYKYKYGMSATPERTDGLTKVIFFATGPLIHNLELKEVSNYVVTPTYISYDTQYTFPLFDTSEYQRMITDLSANDERNNLIIEKVKDYPTQQIIMLCRRKEQTDLLGKAIPDSIVITSKTPAKKRIEIMEGINNRKYRIVISTYELFGTGIDVDTLEILFMCAPIKSKILTKQIAGRLMRISTKIKKNPIIVDFADKQVDLLRNQFYQRSKLLKKL